MDRVDLQCALPVGVQRATVVVPKPFQKVPTLLCGFASERDGADLRLACPAGTPILSIDFAAFGTPDITGECAAWRANATCNDNTTLVHSIVAKVSPPP